MGCGGGGVRTGGVSASTGGSCAFAQAGVQGVDGQTFSVIVGGGINGVSTVLPGSGGFAGGGISAGAGRGGGGGMSAVQSPTGLLLVGGGDPFGGNGVSAGNSTGTNSTGGTGATQTSGGSTGTGTSGAFGLGGAGAVNGVNAAGAGGGGGYFGGGGVGQGLGSSGGGGGSSLVPSGGITAAGTGVTAPRATDPYYVSGVAVGGTQSGNGGPGLVVVSWWGA